MLGLICTSNPVDVYLLSCPGRYVRSEGDAVDFAAPEVIFGGDLSGQTLVVPMSDQGPTSFSGAAARPSHTLSELCNPDTSRWRVSVPHGWQ